MPKTGILLEVDNQDVKDVNFGLITAARDKGSNEVLAFTTEELGAEAQNDLARYGVSQLIRLRADSADITSSPDNCAVACVQAAREYGLEFCLGLATAFGRDIFARMAALLDVELAADVLQIDFKAKTALKSHFSGKTMATISLQETPGLLTVRPNAISPVEQPASLESSVFQADIQSQAKVAVKEIKTSDDRKMDLTEAPIIITGGRPIGKPENYAMLQECADVLGGAVGASRAAVDAGYAPHSMQVGQTGKTVSPNLYLACGVSGAVQHFAGMKTSKVIVGINKDKDAPIFEKCDYGIVGDMFEVVPALTKALQKEKQG